MVSIRSLVLEQTRHTALDVKHFDRTSKTTLPCKAITLIVNTEENFYYKTSGRVMFCRAIGSNYPKDVVCIRFFPSKPVSIQPAGGWDKIVTYLLTYAMLLR